MRYLKLFLLLGVLPFVSCSKADNNDPKVTAPGALTVVANVINDSSGTVDFAASASGATTYEFDFGDGVLKTSGTGTISYKYAKTGTYNVTVLAKNSAGFTSNSVKVDVLVGSAILWADEFNYTGAPDATKWGYDVGTGNNGWGNAELQYYTNRTDNAMVSGGTLKIIAKKETMGGMNYTSARLLTKGKFAFKYGKVEVRAKLPLGGGTWPAIWMLGANIDAAGWPACGEIDIMEHKGNDLNRIFHTMHYPGHSGGGGVGTSTVVPNVTGEFHVYTAEWTAASIEFFVDGVKKYTFPNNAGIPFNHDFFILLNVAMGGTFGGAVAADFTSATMEIDYVRVYR